MAASQAAAATDIQLQEKLLEMRTLEQDARSKIGQVLYGSQVTPGPDGVPRLHPIEDPDNVDSRRSAVSLPPLKEYLEHLERQIGKPIERQ